MKPASIPDTVPFEKLDENKKEDYKELVEIRAQEIEKEDPNLTIVTSEHYEKVLERLSNIEKRLGDQEEAKKINEDDKVAYLASILGDQPFIKKYTLYGMIEVIFRELKSIEIEDILNSSQSITPDIELERRLLLHSLTSAKGFEKAPALLDADKRNAYTAFTKELPRPVFQGLLAAYRDFTKLTTDLSDKALEPNFWLGGVQS